MVNNDLIYNTILHITLIITVIYTLIIILSMKPEKEERYYTPPRKTEREEKESFYMELLNASTGEVLQFRNKKEFINTIKGYDTIKYFLKGTDEENIKQLIEWYYPGFKKL